MHCDAWNLSIVLPGEPDRAWRIRGVYHTRGRAEMAAAEALVFGQARLVRVTPCLRRREFPQPDQTPCPATLAPTVETQINLAAVPANPI